MDAIQALDLQPIEQLKPGERLTFQYFDDAMCGSIQFDWRQTLMIYEGKFYRAVIGNIGATITRKSDGASAWMQGNEADQLQTVLDKLETYNYPRGPFKTLAEHTDVILDA